MMDSEWTHKLQSDIEAETALHKSNLTSVKASTVLFGGIRSPKWYKLDNLPVVDGILDVDAAVAAGKASCVDRCRLVAACLLSFDLDHEEILEGQDASMATVDLSEGGRVPIPKVLPRFQDLTEVVLFFRAIELVPTRRVRLARTGRRAKTRRLTNGLKPPM